MVFAPPELILCGFWTWVLCAFLQYTGKFNKMTGVYPTDIVVATVFNGMIVLPSFILYSFYLNLENHKTILPPDGIWDFNTLSDHLILMYVTMLSGQFTYELIRLRASLTMDIAVHHSISIVMMFGMINYSDYGRLPMLMAAFAEFGSTLMNLNFLFDSWIIYTMYMIIFPASNTLGFYGLYLQIPDFEHPVLNLLGQSLVLIIILGRQWHWMKSILNTVRETLN
jgi:hypothetical protein